MICCAVHSAVGHGVTATCRSVEVPDHKKDVKRLKPDGPNAEEVASPYIRFMSFQELSPSRGGPSMVATHVLGDGPGRNSKSQSCEFSLNASLTPKPIFSGHPPDERLKLMRNRLSTTPSALPTRSPRPISTPTPSMPPQDGLGLHNKQRIAPIIEHVCAHHIRPASARRPRHRSGRGRRRPERCRRLQRQDRRSSV